MRKLQKRTAEWLLAHTSEQSARRMQGLWPNLDRKILTLYRPGGATLHLHQDAIFKRLRSQRTACGYPRI